MNFIEIVRTSRPELSSLSSVSAHAIKKALLTEYEHVVITTVDTLDDVNKLIERSPDLVFMGLKYVSNEGEKIWIAKYLNKHGITTTGSGSAAHQLELDKSKAKAKIISMGLMTSPYFVVKDNAAHDGRRSVTFPAFVKPTSGGGGLGIDASSVVHSNVQLQAKVASIQLNHSADSLVEGYLSGREFSVALLSDGNGGYDAMPIELVAPLNVAGTRLLSAEVKSADAERASKISDKSLEARISTLALGAFNALGAKDYGRIDIRLDEFGTPHFLEANLIPSLMQDYGSYPKACKLHKNLDFTDMIVYIAELAVARAPAEPATKPVVQQS